jgi:hypothetical protein
MATEELKKKPTFREQLTALINLHSMENGSSTPDFILADYLNRALESFDKAILERDHWYGKTNGVNYGD